MTTKTRNLAKKAAAPPITDPLLAALLNYIHGATPETAGFTTEVAIARRVLYGTHDRCTAFGDHARHEVCLELFAALSAKDRHNALVLDELKADEVITAVPRLVYDLLVSAVDHAQTIGAVIMFDVLKGGAR